jgi:fructose-1,6-bisphosphatase/inositol monophosphatase family enzyme
MAARRSYLATSALMEAAIEAVQLTVQRVNEVMATLGTDPEKVANELARLQKVSGHDARKGMLGLDHEAETNCKKLFLDRFSENLQFVGEESLASFSKWGPERYCVLADMLDGTDLLEMEVNLWCSAIIIFDQVQHKIIGGVVGLPSGQVFHAQEGEDSASIRVGSEDFDVSGPSEVKSLGESRICFYGQKFDRIYALAENANLQAKFAAMSPREKDIFRIYNFAGNPMLVKLGNRPKTSDNSVLTGDVDAVFEIAGQQVHDMAAGAYIAKKAGAYLCDLSGEETTLDALAMMLEQPRQRVSYVIASTKSLATELTEVLSGNNIALGEAANTA